MGGKRGELGKTWSNWVLLVFSHAGNGQLVDVFELLFVCNGVEGVYN